MTMYHTATARSSCMLVPHLGGQCLGGTGDLPALPQRGKGVLDVLRNGTGDVELPRDGTHGPPAVAHEQEPHGLVKHG